MPRLPTARRRLVGAAALLLALALPSPRAAGLDALLGRLLAAWREVTAGVEGPAPAEEPDGTDTAAPPSTPPSGDRGPSLDPDGNALGDDERPADAIPP